VGNVRFGAVTPYFPPAELVGAAAATYEGQGYDFLLSGDQLNTTSPRSLWSPDLVPAAGLGIEIDAWMDAFQVCTLAALATSHVEVGLTCDALRRTPVNLAQQLFTLDHISKGRAYLCLGAGEQKQFRSFGLKRTKPFTHLEEAIRILVKFRDLEDAFDHDGPIWTLRKAHLRLAPFDRGKPPGIFVAGGPGRSIEIAGKYADGWATYLPPAGPPEWLASQVASLRMTAEKAGRDPDRLRVLGMISACIATTEEAVESAIQSPIVKWDSACIVPSGATWRRFGFQNPLGDDFHYARDYDPADWDRPAALRIVEQVPDTVVRGVKVCGVPKDAARQILPFIEAGLTDVLIGNYAALTTTGDWGDAGTEDASFTTVDLLRNSLGLHRPAAHADEAVGS
jgi:phthiodiolone/phenolphthiodiolone dimycocerosates ketoreductase